MNEKWGKFTVRGSAKLEEKIHEQMFHIQQRLISGLAKFPVEAVLLLGGYGRGEGGVEIKEGQEYPHNNFDFLVITPPLSGSEDSSLRRETRKLFDELAEEVELGIDYAVSNSRKLAFSPCLVMWYDMRFGHKVIIGPSDYMDQFTHFSKENILQNDALALLVNRATLFVINKLMLHQRSELSERDKRWFIKHVVKALIGYGDALLYFLGDYNWSYEEKGRRMAKRSDVDEDFKARYLDALDFRFSPRYGEYFHLVGEQWLEENLRSCEAVHLRCEQIRLSRSMENWKDYGPSFFQFSLWDRPLSLRGWARKAINAFRSDSCPLSELSLFERMGYYAGGGRGKILCALPGILYEGKPLAKELSCRLLGLAKNAKPHELIERYLQLWAIVGDTNFARGLSKMGLHLHLGGGSDDLPNRGRTSYVLENRGSAS